MSNNRTTNFLQRRDRWGHGYPLWIIAVVVFLIPLVFWSLRGIRMHNDVSSWLPQDDPQARTLAWHQHFFPSEHRVLVSWDDCTLTDPRIQQLRDHLMGPVGDDGDREGGSPFVQKVSTPHDLLDRMLASDIEFPEALTSVTGVLIGDGPLCIQLTDAGRERGDFMKSEIRQAADNLLLTNLQFVERSLPVPATPVIDPDDESALLLHDHLVDHVRSQPLYDFQLTWDSMHTPDGKREAFRRALTEIIAPAVSVQTVGKTCVEQTFFIPGALAAVSVSLSDAGKEEKREAVAAIAAAAEDCGIPTDTLRMGGQPVVGAQLNAAVKNSAWNRSYPVWKLPYRSPVLMSAVVGIFFAFVMLRSFRLAVIVQLVSLLTVLATVALVPPTGGSMNMVLVVMPTLLAVLTTSAAIHLANYWKHSPSQSPTESVFRAAGAAWLPCALASMTTAIGMASLIISTLIPVRDFGAYSAVGCGISFCMVLYFMPSVMLYWRDSPPAADHNEQTGHWAVLGRFLARHRWSTIAACCICTAVCAWGLRYFRTETKVIRYFPDESRLVQDYRFLEDNLSGIVSVDTIIRFDRNAQDTMSFVERARLVRTVQRDIRTHPDISGVLSLASFIDIGDPLEGLENASALRKRLAIRKQNELDRVITERLRSGGESAEDLASFLARPEEDFDLYESGDRLLNASGDELWRITAQAAIMSDTDLGALTDQLNDTVRRHVSGVGSARTGHVITGLIPVFLRTQQAVLESLIRSFGLAFGLIAVVMILLTRHPLAGIGMMLPNLMPVLVVFGLLAWSDIRVDIGTMVTASVALGIAVDGTLHLLTWFRRLVAQGLSVEDAVAGALQHCGPAMWQTSAAVGFGMLTLFTAELLLISRFGWIMAGLIAAALVADVIFMPALLAGPVGELIRRKELRQSESADCDERPESPATDSDAVTEGSQPTDERTSVLNPHVRIDQPQNSASVSTGRRK